MKQYYHGTSYYSAYRILNEGFRLIKYYGGGGVKGSGIYVTDNLDYAFDMARSKGWVNEGNPNKTCIIECDLKITQPIFWTKKEYDPKVIKYLKKEFDKRIIDSDYDISKFIPKNKKLTKKEVVNLVNFWGVQSEKEREKERAKRNNSWRACKVKGDSSYLSNVRFLLSRYNYSSWGQYTHDCWDSDEIVVFNPSEVVPIKVYGVTGDWDKKELTYENSKLMGEVSLEDLKEGYEWEKNELKKDDEKWEENISSDMYK